MLPRALHQLSAGQTCPGGLKQQNECFPLEVSKLSLLSGSSKDQLCCKARQSRLRWGAAAPGDLKRDLLQHAADFNSPKRLQQLNTSVFWMSVLNTRVML